MNSHKQTPRGVVYVATGERFVNEALASATSLRQHNPDLAICLISDAASISSTKKCDVFDHFITHPAPAFSVLDKTAAPLAPFERVLFLDSDTFVTESITDIFDILDQFDIGATQENMRGWDYTIEGIPLAFPEYTTGMIVFRNNELVQSFFKNWEETYKELLAANPEAQKRYVQNQPAFKKAIYFSELRIATLPTEYHFVINCPNYIMWTARVLHGKGDLAAIAQDVNSNTGGRVFIPELGVYSGFRGKKALLNDCRRFLYRSAKMFFTR